MIINYNLDGQQYLSNLSKFTDPPKGLGKQLMMVQFFGEGRQNENNKLTLLIKHATNELGVSILQVRIFI